MGYEPQRFTAPDGTEMVVMRAADFERLQALAEDSEDVIGAEATLARIAAGEGTVPGEVVDLILDKGLNPVAAWRRYRGLSQAELARRAGLSQVWVSRIEAGGGHGTPATRRKLAKALDAPLWALEDTQDELGTGGRPIVPTFHDFHDEIARRIEHGRAIGLSSLRLTTGEIHRAVGGYPGPNHRMPECCRAMREAVDRFGGRIVGGPPKGQGASLEAEFPLRAEA